MGIICASFGYLPKQAYSGARDQHSAGGSFTTGLYARLKVSLRRNSTLFPNSTKVITKFVRQVFPDHKFTSVIIFDSVETSLHVDALNAQCDNLVVGLSEFTGGDLWVEWPSCAPRDSNLQYETRAIGSENVLGALLPVSKHPVWFCAKGLRHATCRFQGRRIVLVAYSLQATDHANPSDRKVLLSLGFQLPEHSDLNYPNSLPPRILHGTDCAALSGGVLCPGFLG